MKSIKSYPRKVIKSQRLSGRDAKEEVSGHSPIGKALNDYAKNKDHGGATGPADPFGMTDFSPMGRTP